MKKIENYFALYRLISLFCFLTKCIFGVLAVSLVVFIVFASQSQAQICIPKSDGVPGTLLWQHPPNWYDPTPGFPRYDTRIDAPGWRGAFSNSHPFGGTGTGEHVKFRALHRAEGGTEYLYLSWHAKVAPDIGDLGNNLVWVGFSNPASTLNGQDVALGVELNATNNQTAATIFTPRLMVKPAGSSDSAWTASSSIPYWLATSASGWARIWITGAPGGSGGEFAIHMRVPTTTTSTDLNVGIPIGSTFKMWYEFRVKSPTTPLGFIPYKWPIGIGDMDPIFDFPPPIGDWDPVTLTLGTPESPDPACPTEGVALRPEDIGTTNPNPRNINIVSPNTFFARPRNQAGNPANDIRARFRIANWGVNATREDVPNPANTLWADIGSPTGEPPLGLDIPGHTQGNITFPYTVSTFCEKCAYRDFYIANSAACDADASCVAAGTNNTKSRHQCLLVELSGTGVTFLNDSAYRNMDFVNASEFSETAEINILGLPAQVGGRTVYLYIEALNMPSRIPPAGVERKSKFAGSSLAQTSKKKRGDDVQVSVPVEVEEKIDFEEISEFMPTYRVHAYYDSGKRKVINQVEHLILRPMTSIGYFVKHEGSLNGWKHNLAGVNLVEIAPNFYKIQVPEEGVSTVTTNIKAVEHGFAVNARVGAAIPNGSFNSDVDPGLSLNIGLEYLINPSFSAEAIFGFHQFDDDGLGDDLDIYQFSLNGRYYFPPIGIWPFINAGVGIYDLSPGDTEFGFNLGAGAQYDLTSQLSLEGAYNFHYVDTSNPDVQFSTIQIGLRYQF